MAAVGVMGGPISVLCAPCLPSASRTLNFQGGLSTPPHRSRCPSISELHLDDSSASLRPESPRRRSPSLESVVSAQGGDGESDGPPRRRRVRFDTELSLHTDFTPYGQVYGLHPKSFFLNDEGRMVQEFAPSMSICRDLVDVDDGDTIECTLGCGVGYRSAPRMNARAPDFCHVAEGQQTKVRERRGEWVRDDIGWLPLFVRGVAVFEIVPPMYSIDLGPPRSGVLTVQASREAMDGGRSRRRP